MKTALLVDHDYFFVEFLAGLLAQRGFEVLKASDGKEGIACLEPGPVDIIFADLVLPKIDSRRFFRFVRRKFRGQCPHIVAISGALIEQLGSLEELGADFFIAKGPMDILARQIDDFLNRLERDPASLNGSRHLVAAGCVFPRRDAVELLEALHFQRAVVDGLGVGVVVVDKDGRIIDANPLALRITGRGELEMLNRPVLEIFPAKGRSSLARALKEAFTAPQDGPRGFTAVFGERTVTARVSALQVDGRPVGWALAMFP